MTFDAGVNVATPIGRTIDLFDWTGVTPTGAFTVTSPYTWNLSKLYTTGEVTLTAVPGVLPGDFNHNGTVDAADYIVWRKKPGANYTADDYNAWRTNFGQSLGSGAWASSAESPHANVPEPSTLTITFMAILRLMARRNRRHSNPSACS